MNGVFFVIFGRSYRDVNDITENILNYRNEKEFYKVERFLNDSSKKIDERISDLFYLSSVLEFKRNTDEILIRYNKIDYTKNIISNFEKKMNNNKIPYPLENGERGEYEEKLYDPKPLWE